MLHVSFAWVAWKNKSFFKAIILSKIQSKGMQPVKRSQEQMASAVGCSRRWKTTYEHEGDRWWMGTLRSRKRTHDLETKTTNDGRRATDYHQQSWKLTLANAFGNQMVCLILIKVFSTRLLDFRCSQRIGQLRRISHLVEFGTNQKPGTRISLEHTRPMLGH